MLTPGARLALIKLLIPCSFCPNYAHGGIAFKDLDSSLVLRPFRCQICDSFSQVDRLMREESTSQSTSSPTV